MVDVISSRADKPPVAVQPVQQVNQKPNTKPAEVRLEEQKVEATFDFEALAEAVARVQEYSDMVSGTALSFSIDNQLKRPVISVVDSESQSLVRQIPSEEILEVARILKSQQAESERASAVRGLIFDQKT